MDAQSVPRGPGMLEELGIEVERTEAMAGQLEHLLAGVRTVGPDSLASPAEAPYNQLQGTIVRLREVNTRLAHLIAEVNL